MITKKIFIQCRVSIQEKDDWMIFTQAQKFPSISELIRFSVNNIIENDLNRSDNWFYFKNERKLNKNNYIRVRITEDEKEKWAQYARENGFPSISELIRFSVNMVIETEIRFVFKRRGDLYLMQRTNRYYQDELNKLLTIPSCKNCGHSGIAWLSNDGLCLDCHNEKEIQFRSVKSQKEVKNINIELPKELIEKIKNELESNNFLAYRTHTEFIIDATRRRIEEVQKIRAKS